MWLSSSSIISNLLCGYWSIFLVPTLACLLAYVSWRNSRFVKLIDKIPGPKGLPILGNAWELNVDQAEFLKIVHHKWVEEHGDIFKATVTTRAFVVISSPELMEPILSSSKVIEKSAEYHFLSPWLGNCMFLTTGERWRSRRRLLTPAFHFQILSSFFDVFNEQSQNLIARFYQVTKEQPGEEIDIFPYLTKCALDIICETSMGRQVRKDEEIHSYVKALHRIGQIVMERGVRPWLYNDFIYRWTPLGRENRKCIKILHKFTNQVIKDRRAALKKEAELGLQNVTCDNNNKNDISKPRMAFLDLLINASQDGAVLSDEDIREEVDTTMFAGHDTTASAMTWFIYCIARHPEEQKLVVEEIDEIFGDSDRPCTTQDVSQMRYLECCIKEALRLYPSVPAVMRKLNEDIDIGDYTIPSGTSVALLIYGMHHNARVYPEPEKYKPERFLPEQSADRHPYAFIPFSAGPRNCIGQKYGMLETKVVLSNLLRHFTFSVRDNQKAMERPSSEVVLKPIKGVPVIITRRTRSL